MYQQLVEIDRRPRPYEKYTAKTLWDDAHTSKAMLKWHLDPHAELASRNHSFIQKSVAWICSRFQVGTGFRIADFGCGPGLYTTPFAESGATVVGIDFSGRSIDHAREEARKRGLAIDYFEENYLDFRSYLRFDLITMIYCDLCALGDSQRKRLFSIFHRHLKAGGMLLLDVFTVKAFEAREEASVFGNRLMDGFWSENDYYGFLKTIKYEAEHLVLDKYTIVAPERRLEVYNWLKYYSRASLGRELSENGFEVTELYSDVAGSLFSEDSDTMAVIARKASSEQPNAVS